MMDSSGNGQVYTLDEALTMVGFGKFQALVLVYAGLRTMAEAMEVIILSFIGPAIKSDWGTFIRARKLDNHCGFYWHAYWSLFLVYHFR